MMRFAVFAAMVLLSACAGDTLELKPPSGVDFSGHWKLNEADSDDPLRLSQAAAQAAANAANNGAGGGSGGGSGGGGRGGRGGARGAPGGGLSGGPVPPTMSAMGMALRWPGQQLEIKQVAGVVAFASGGKNRVCEPSKEKRHRHPADDDAPLPSARDAPPPTCGWSEKTLVIHTADPDEDGPPFEERYSLSEDGQRLIEVVGFKGGRSNGFTMSRVWDKID